MGAGVGVLKGSWWIGQSAEDLACLHAAHFQMGQTLFWMGQFMPAQTHLELSCSLYDPTAYPSHGADLPGFCKGVHSLMFSGLSVWHLGFPDQARDRLERALSLARQQADPFCLCLALAGSSHIDRLRGETIAASKFANAMFHLAQEQGFRGFLAMATAGRGATLGACGQAEEGITQLRAGLERSE